MLTRRHFTTAVGAAAVVASMPMVALAEPVIAGPESLKAAIDVYVQSRGHKIVRISRVDESPLPLDFPVEADETPPTHIAFRRRYSERVPDGDGSYATLVRMLWSRFREDFERQPGDLYWHTEPEARRDSDFATAVEYVTMTMRCAVLRPLPETA